MDVTQFVEIAGVHFRSGDGEGGAVGAGAVAEPLVGEEEECVVPAFFDLGNPDRAADGDAEIVLLIDGIGDAGGVAEEVIGVEIVVAEEFVGRAVELSGAGLGDDRP